MKRGAELKRSGFGRARTAGAAGLYLADREQRLAARATRACTAVVARASSTGPAETTAAPKEPKPARSEPYRRLVAARPCISCGIEGQSQHAHENLDKGGGKKVDDRRAMPLCCTRPGIEGCHVAFDQGRLLEGGRDAHRAAGQAWAAQTRAAILESGQWPKKLPVWAPDA
ncbi:MAG: hypothetical protein RR831_18645 [Stenotrophomonas sp.]